MSEKFDQTSLMSFSLSLSLSLYLSLFLSLPSLTHSLSLSLSLLHDFSQALHFITQRKTEQNISSMREAAKVKRLNVILPPELLRFTTERRLKILQLASV